MLRNLVQWSIVCSLTCSVISGRISRQWRRTVRHYKWTARSRRRTPWPAPAWRRLRRCTDLPTLQRSQMCAHQAALRTPESCLTRKILQKLCFVDHGNWVPHCHTSVVLVIIPIPQLWCFVEEDVACVWSLINCFTIWVNCQDVIIIKYWLWANSSDFDFPHFVFKLTNRTVWNGTILNGAPVSKI